MRIFCAALSLSLVLAAGCSQPTRPPGAPRGSARTEHEVSVNRLMDSLQQYKGVEMGEIESDIGEKISPELVEYMNGRLLSLLEKDDLIMVGGVAGERLIVEGKVTSFIADEDGTRIDVNVTFHDAHNLNTIGSVRVEAKNRSPNAGEDVADGVAEGVKKFISEQLRGPE